MAERGGSHEQHVEAGRKGGEHSHSGGQPSEKKEQQSGSKGGETRGGSHEQHVKAGQQSHKNTK